jgi:hypothetical protein
MTVSSAMSALLLVVFTTMVVIATGFPDGARFMPMIVGIPAIALCAVQLVMDWRSRTTAPRSRKSAELGPHTVAGELRAWGWFLAFIALVLLVGFVIAAPALVFGYLWREAGVRPTRAALAAAAFTGWIWGMFEHLLGFALHPGLWGGAILSAIGMQ